jgi:uncharacterized protein YdaU (DUF1376 family)
MKTSQSFPFYSSDFIMGTMLMTTEEVGAYIRLLCWQWEQGSVPADPAKITRITGIKYSRIGTVLQKFDQDSEGNWKNFRLEEVRTDRENFMEVQRRNGKKGGRPKGERPKPSDSQTKPMGYDWVTNGLTQSEPEKTLPFPSPLPSPNTPKPPRGNEFTAVEIAVSAIHSSRTPKPFTPAERNSLNELRTRITDEELIADAEAIKNAKDKGWEFFARTRPAMLGKWESQADLARNYNPNRAKPPVKRDLSMFAF